MCIRDSYWDATKTFNEESQKSAAFGFSFDATQVANEITACTNVVNKYHKALEMCIRDRYIRVLMDGFCGEKEKFAAVFCKKLVERVIIGDVEQMPVIETGAR